MSKGACENKRYTTAGVQRLKGEATLYDVLQAACKCGQKSKYLRATHTCLVNRRSGGEARAAKSRTPKAGRVKRGRAVGHKKCPRDRTAHTLETWFGPFDMASQSLSTCQVEL